MGKMIENYSLQNEIGRGMYSTVYRAINIKTKQEVAIKVVKAEKFKQFPKLEEGTYNEINILSNLEGCPHIIKYYDMLKTVNNFYFVYEYCNGGTLEKLLKEKGALPESAALTYFFQIMEAFRVLRRNNIMHRDLKPQNLLMHDGVVKMGDFGFCKPLQSEDEMSMTMLGSPIYMAPEILKGERYSIKSDIWSLGVVLFRMFYGFCPFESNNIGKLIMVIQEEDMVIPLQPSVSPEAIKLLKRMLTKNPTLRADWAQIFAYQLRNGELTRQGLLRPKTPTNLKRSFTMTECTKASLQNSMRLRSQQTQQQQSSTDIHYNPNKASTQTELRTTFSAKNPFSENFKRDVLLKNHQKSIDMMSLAVSMINLDPIEAVVVAYLIFTGVEKELKNVYDSAKKELEIKPSDSMLNTLMSSVQSELIDSKTVVGSCVEQLRQNFQLPLDALQGQKKQILKNCVDRMNIQKGEDLVLMCRVTDYINDGLIIRKETYEKMSRDKLLTNLRVKLESPS